ncbi:hypothetical protein [Brasilonema bromeliae]
MGNNTKYLQRLLISTGNPKNIFELSLLLGTVLPIIFFTILSHTQQKIIEVETIKYTLLFLAMAHVSTTVYFYNVKAFRINIISQNKFMYIYTPLILFVFCGCIFTFSSQFFKPYLLLFYWLWQAYHYGKQNIGVYSFISYSQTKKPICRLEKISITLGILAGILPTWKVIGYNVAPSYLHNLINFFYWMGQPVFFAGLILSIYVFIVKNSCFTLLKSIFFFLLVFFFLPIYLSDNILVTFHTYATAHGIQYIIFMTVIAINSEQAKDKAQKQSTLLKSLFLLSLYLIVGGLIFFYSQDLNKLVFIQNHSILSSCTDFLLGGLLGLTMAHFVVDAHAWKLSQVNQRKFILEKFSFIFK